MTRRPSDPDPELVTPACVPTVDRLQAVLDGGAPASILDADPHAITCAGCAERVRAARVLTAVLAVAPEPVTVSSGLTGRILDGVRRDRRARDRRRVFAVAGGLAAAAAVVLVVWQGGFFGPGVQRVGESVAQVAPDVPPVTPVLPPHPGPPEPGPAPRAVNLGSEFAKTRDAFRDSIRPLTDPAGDATELLPSFTVTLPEPMTPTAPDLGPARLSLAEIPEAARTGLTPLADSAQKAFGRLVHHVNAVQPAGAGKPKS